MRIERVKDAMPGAVRASIQGMRAPKGGKTAALIFCPFPSGDVLAVWIRWTFREKRAPLFLIHQRLYSQLIAFDSKSCDDALGNRSSVRVMPEAFSGVDIADMHLDCGNLRTTDSVS